MAAEAIFRQVRRPPPRIYRGIALFCLLDQRWNRWGRWLSFLEEGGDTHACAGSSELELLVRDLLVTPAPVREGIG